MRSSVVKLSALSDPSLLRASAARTVLRRFGKILRNSEGSSSTYSLSAPVQQIKWFMSHNWSTPRSEKFLVLALYFNLGCSLFVTLLVLCSLTVITAARALPLPLIRDDVGYSGICCQILGAPIAFLVLFLGHDICPCAVRQTVFLDKTCIHQTDLVKKASGIESLGAFLQRSSGMLIIYADTYLRKIWTVYELAAFLILNPQGHLMILPIFLPRIVLGNIASLYIRAILYLLLASNEGAAFLANTAWYVIVFFIICVNFYLAHGFAAYLNSTSETIKNFEVAQALCLKEADRNFVYDNIASLMRHIGLCQSRGNRDQALHTFEELVRYTLKDVLDESIGNNGVRYRYVAFA